MSAPINSRLENSAVAAGKKSNRILLSLLLCLISINPVLAAIPCSQHAGTVVLNEVYLGSNQFIEVKFIQNILLSGWELCYLNNKSKEACVAGFPTNGSYSANTYGVLDIPSSKKLNVTEGEIILLDDQGEAVDKFQYCNASSCPSPHWDVASACSSVLTNHGPNNKDMARLPDGTGDLQDDGKDSTKGTDNGGGGGGADAYAFNCVEINADALTGRLYTKAVGQSILFDLVALKDSNGDGGADTTEVDYASASDRTVAVELIDTSGVATCGSYPGLSPGVSQNITFSAGDRGRKASAAVSLSKAYRSVGCRVTDSSGATPVTACSTDVFSVRPLALTVAAPVLTNGGSSGTPVSVAGAVFGLQATGSVGYDGVPSIDPSVPLLVHAGAVQTGNLTGLFGAADPATGTAVGNNFVYSEVGNFRFRPLSVIDTGFTSVDQPGDCTDDYSNNPNGAGKIGCKFGNLTLSDWIGRFTPDHFTLSVDIPGALANTCPAGGFSYSGQRIDYAAGQEPAVTITAWNGLATPTVTTNYTGVYDHLGLGGILMPAIIDDGSRLGADSINRVGLAWTLGVASLTDNGDGTIGFGLNGDGFTYAREPNDLVAPFISDIDLEITSVTDDDGISATGLPLIITPTGVQVRYGRLALQNAHGSELQNLRVPLQSEYYDGLAHGFVSNGDDSCTQGLTVSLSDLDGSDDLLVSTGAGRETDVFADASVAGGYAASDLSDASLLFTQPTTGGEFNLNLRAPGEGNTGSAGVFVDAPNWLEFDWQGSGMSDPAAKATFGIFRRSNSIIYLREAR